MGEEIRFFRSNNSSYYLKIYLGDEEIREDIADVVLENVSNNKIIGDINSKILTLKLFNATKYNLTNDEITLYLVYTEGSREVEKKLGVFKVLEVTEKDKKKDEVSVKARDLSYKFNSKVKDILEIVEFPTTINNLIDRLGEFYNLRILKNNLANLSYEIEKQVFIKDGVLGNLLSNIAEATGSNIYINEDNIVVFEGVEIQKQIELNESDLFEFKYSDIGIDGYNTIVASRVKVGGGTTEDIYYSSVPSENKKEYKIYSNEVIDTNRSLALPGILEKIEHLSYFGGEIEVKIAAFLKPNKVIKIVAKEGVKNIIVQDFKHDFTNGNTILSCEIENKEKTDFKRATTNEKIAKAEFYIDKVAGRVESRIENILRENDILKEKMSKLEQNVDGFNFSIQTSGGNNLIKNSVMFEIDNSRLPNNWDISGDGTLIIDSSPNSKKYGGLSGNSFRLINKAVRQKVFVKNSNIDIDNIIYYSFSCRVQKDYTTAGIIRLYNDFESHEIVLDPNEKYFYKEFAIEKLLPKFNYYILEITSTAGEIEITDPMLTIGEKISPWKLAQGELQNSNVLIGEDGIKINSNTKDVINLSNSEISIKDENNKELAKINKDGAEFKSINTQSGFIMPPLKIVPITTGNKRGWGITAIGDE